MDNSLYKEVKVERGLTYRYYFSPPTGGKPFLLFLHGFPSTSHDWVRQVQHFQPKGYGIIVPDMLGLGGTSRPLDVKAFRLKLRVKDIIDILDKENVDKVIGVAHDWGSASLNGLSMRYPDRLIGHVYLGVSILLPSTTIFDLDAALVLMKQTFGREIYAYWKFFDREDAASIIEKNIDSFIQLIYPKDPECWHKYLCSIGGFAEWFENSMAPGFADYLTKEEIDVMRQDILDGGIASALNYYKAAIQNVDLEDSVELQLPENWKIEKPCFFAATHNDAVCTPQIFKPLIEKYAKDLTTIDCYTGHWVQFEASDQLNSELEAWLQKKFSLSRL